MRDVSKNIFNPRICCLGTRSGKEIDLFRIAFSSNIILIFFMNIFSRYKILEKLFIKYILQVGRKNINFEKDQYCFGVEINPDAKRKDVLISNFDFISDKWNNKFNIIFSNSFDQSMDPKNTSKKWIDLSEKKISYFIICFSNCAPTETDPTGYITLNDINSLFPGEVIYYSKNISVYEEVIIKSN